MTRPGVDRIPYAMIAASSVTWSIAPSTPALASASRVFASSRLQLAQPWPSTLMSFMRVRPLGSWVTRSLPAIVRRSRRSGGDGVEQVADGDDPRGHDGDEHGQQARLHHPAEDHELGHGQGG